MRTLDGMLQLQQKELEYVFSEDVMRLYNSLVSIHIEHLCLSANYVKSKGVPRKLYELEEI